MKVTLVAAAIALALAACSSMRPEHADAGARSLDNKTPKVFVRNKCQEQKAHIVVDQEPVQFFLSDNKGPFDVTWRLMTPGYTFGKVTDPTPTGDIRDCKKSTSGMTITCTNLNTNAGNWKYTLDVIPSDDNKCGAPRPLDPWVSND